LNIKKILLVILLSFMTVGCTSINNKELNVIINESVNVDNTLYNEIRNGYKYYVPRGLKNIKSTEYNEKLTDNNHYYFLYIDVVSYFNKVQKQYEINNNAYYSNSISVDEKFGYVEINKYKTGEYLIEIMYNYAKIEVIVEESSLRNVLTHAINILTSINYNENILENMMGNNILQFKEIEFDIFETRRNDDGYLYYGEDEDSMDEVIPDTDLIR